jgi:hypothetical protein
MYNEGVHPQEFVCSSCAPAGMRFVRVRHGIFSLYLADVNGQLRIAGVDPDFLGGLIP